MRALGLFHGKMRIVAFANSSSFHSLLTSREIFQEVSETMAFIISGDKCRHWEIGGIPLARYPGPTVRAVVVQGSSRPRKMRWVRGTRGRDPPCRLVSSIPASTVRRSWRSWEPHQKKLRGSIRGFKFQPAYDDQDALKTVILFRRCRLQIVNHDVIIIDDSESESESESFARGTSES